MSTQAVDQAKEPKEHKDYMQHWIGPAEAVITYRHLFSQAAFTSANPLRVIAHCDLDAAYAQFERKRLGLPLDAPVVVQQWSGLIAVSYPARAFGITRHEDVNQARLKCPGLVAVHVATYREGDQEAGYWTDVKPDPNTHKVSLDPYRREGQKVVQVFRSVFAGLEVEKASIDEAYIDFTPEVRKIMLERYPQLRAVPADAPAGLDSPLPPPPFAIWPTKSHVIPTQVEGRELEGVDHSFFDQSDRPSWHDVALSIGAECMQKIRDCLHQELDYTCSAGIARNKTLAKLCSAFRKPDQQSILRKDAIPAFLGPMSFQKIRMLGGKLGDAIAKEFDATTVGDLWAISAPDLQKRFGQESMWVYNILRGMNYDDVKEKTANKSMLASKNLAKPPSRAEMSAWLQLLSSELAMRLQEARETRPTLWPKTLTLGLRQAFKAPRHRQMQFPYTNSNLTEAIRKCADKLYQEMVTDERYFLPKLNNVALSFQGLEALESGQQGISGFFSQQAAVGEQPKCNKRSSKDDIETVTKKRSTYRPVEPIVIGSDDEDDEIQIVSHR